LHDLVAFQLSRSWFKSNHYAKKADLRYFLYRYVRIALYCTSAVLLLGASIMSLTVYKSTIIIKQKGEAIILKKASRTIELKNLRDKIPPLPADIVLLANIVDSGDYLKAQHILPRPILEKLSQVLNRHHDIFLERLEWEIASSPSTIFKSSTTNQNEEIVLTKHKKHKTPVNEKFESEKHFIEGIKLHGKIHSFNGDYLYALRIFNKFVADLRLLDVWLVNVLWSPYDAGQKFQGQIGEQAAVAEASYIVDILIKHNHAQKTF